MTGFRTINTGAVGYRQQSAGRHQTDHTSQRQIISLPAAPPARSLLGAMPWRGLAARHEVARAISGQAAHTANYRLGTRGSGAPAALLQAPRGTKDSLADTMIRWPREPPWGAQVGVRRCRHGDGQLVCSRCPESVWHAAERSGSTNVTRLVDPGRFGVQFSTGAPLPRGDAHHNGALRRCDCRGQTGIHAEKRR